MQSLRSPDDLDAVLTAPLAVLYKHSSRCPISALAADQVEEFAEEHPDVPVHVLDVVQDRALSREVADRLGVMHHSPQAIVLARGRVMWHGSHFDVRAPELAGRVGALVGE